MRVHNSLIFATLLAATLPLAQTAAAQATAQATAQTAATLSVTGEGTVETAPDMAIISLGVTSTAKNAAAAMAENSAQLAAVLKTLQAAGIAPRDLQTSGLQLGPNWNTSSSGNSGSGGQIGGYTASNQLTVRVRDLASLGPILDAAVTDGANTLNGVEFAVTNPAPLLDEARRRAVADAQSRAHVLATAAGVALGPIASMAEQQGYNPQPRAYAKAMQSSVPVAQGELTLSASVSIVWTVLPQ